MGMCRFKESCQNLHIEVPPMETKNANGRPYCKYFVCGATCKFGAEKCKGAHDEEYRKEYGKLVSQAKDIAVQKRNMKE